MEEILIQQNETIIELLTKSNEIALYSVNQFFVFMVLVTVLTVTYMLYRIIKNFY